VHHDARAGGIEVRLRRVYTSFRFHAD